MIIVYDITSQKSFDNITKWLQSIKEVSMCDCIKVWLRISYVAMVIPMLWQF